MHQSQIEVAWLWYIIATMYIPGLRTALAHAQSIAWVRIQSYYYLTESHSVYNETYFWVNMYKIMLSMLMALLPFSYLFQLCLILAIIIAILSKVDFGSKISYASTHLHHLT